MDNERAIDLNQIIKEIVDLQKEIDDVTEKQDDLIKRINALQNEPMVEVSSPEGDNESNEIWNRAKQEIEKRLSSVKYNTWFKNLEAVGSENNTMTLMVENEFSKTIIESRYNEFIEKALNYITGEDWVVTFLVKEDPDEFDNIWV